MIEDKKDGIKIAENPVEAAWERVRRNTETRIIEQEIALELDRNILEFANKKLKGQS